MFLFSLFKTLVTGKYSSAEKQQPPSLLNPLELSDENSKTALHYAAGKGAKELVASLIEMGAPIDAVTNKGETALYLATRNICLAKDKDKDSIETIKVLLQKGASRTIASFKGYLPIHAAATCKTDTLIRLLADIHTLNSPVGKTGMTPLHLAISAGSHAVVLYLIDAGADIDLATAKFEPNSTLTHRIVKGSSTAVHFAFYKADLVIIKTILRCSFNPALQNANGKTVTHLAVESTLVNSLQQSELMKLLTRDTLSKRNLMNESIVHAAVRNTAISSEIFSFIVEKSLEIDANILKAKNKDNQTPLMLALSNNHSDKVTILQRLEAEVTQHKYLVGQIGNFKVSKKEAITPNTGSSQPSSGI